MTVAGQKIYLDNETLGIRVGRTRRAKNTTRERERREKRMMTGCAIYYYDIHLERGIMIVLVKGDMHLSLSLYGEYVSMPP